MRRIAAATLVLALSAAGAAGAAPPVDSYPVYFRQIGQVWFETHLKDPYSAKVTLVRGPGWAETPVVWGLKKRGWAVCYRVNAKNAYGGYAGAQTWVLFMDRRNVVDVAREAAPEESNDYIRPGAVEAECAKAPAPAPPGVDLTPGPQALTPG